MTSGNHFRNNVQATMNTIKQLQQRKKALIDKGRDNTALQDTTWGENKDIDQQIQACKLRMLASLDNISESLCFAIDTAETCRNLHTDMEYVSAAHQV